MNAEGEVHEIEDTQMLLAERIVQLEFELQAEREVSDYRLSRIDAAYRRIADLETERFAPVTSPYLTYPEAQEYTRFSRWTLRRAVREGSLPDYGTRKRTLFKKEDLDEWLKDRDHNRNGGDDT